MKVKERTKYLCKLLVLKFLVKSYPSLTMSCWRHKVTFLMKKLYNFLLDSIKIKILANMIAMRIVTKMTTKVVKGMMNWSTTKGMKRTLRNVVKIKWTKVRCSHVHETSVDCSNCVTNSDSVVVFLTQIKHQDAICERNQ